MATNIILFLFGLGFGSFVNVLALRYREDKRIFDFKNLGGRSRCVSCGKILSVLELVPVLSFIFQGGRCKGCKARLNPQYILVELASGFIFLLTPAVLKEMYFFEISKYASGLPIWYYILSGIFILAGLTLVFISAVDYRLRIIPDSSNLFIASLGVLAILVKANYGLFSEFSGSFLGHYAALFGIRSNIWLNHFSGAFFGLFFLGAIVFLSRGKGMGMGDVKLAAAAGFLLGWPDIVIGIFLAFIIGAIFSIILMVRREKGMKSIVPFGPFIALGILLVIFFGDNIMRGYFGLFPTI